MRRFIPEIMAQVRADNIRIIRYGKLVHVHDRFSLATIAKISHLWIVRFPLVPDTGLVQYVNPSFVCVLNPCPVPSISTLYISGEVKKRRSIYAMNRFQDRSPGLV